jgi:hypothetical protein
VHKVPIVVSAGAVFAPLCHVDEAARIKPATAGETTEFRAYTQHARVRTSPPAHAHTRMHVRGSAQ